MTLRPVVGGLRGVPQTTASSMGKGSKPRPLSVDRAKFESEWDRIFSAGTPPPSLTRNIKGEIEATREGARINNHGESGRKATRGR